MDYINNLDSGKSFIHTEYIDLKVCDNLLEYFENHPNKGPGKTYSGNNLTVDTLVKKSTDLHISYGCIDKPITDYLISLQKVLENYIVKFPTLNNQNKFTIVEGFNIQRYYPNEGFFKWHCEISGIKSSSRLLVFTTYLNTINDGGETEFMYQNIKIKPKKGLTMLFPADWMYVHRGVTSSTETKWIATGWFSYVE